MLNILLVVYPQAVNWRKLIVGHEFENVKFPS